MRTFNLAVVYREVKEYRFTVAVRATSAVEAEQRVAAMSAMELEAASTDTWANYEFTETRAEPVRRPRPRRKP